MDEYRIIKDESNLIPRVIPLASETRSPFKIPSASVATFSEGALLIFNTLSLYLAADVLKE